MAAKFNLDVTDSRGGVQPVVSGEYHESMRRLADYFRANASGSTTATQTVTTRNSSAQATGTVTLTSAPAGSVVELNGVDFVAVSGNPVLASGEFDVSGSDTAAATSLAAAINGSASARIANIATATSATNVVTVTAALSGQLGNGLVFRTKGIQANGTVTCLGALAADTVTVNGTVFTAVA